MVPTGLKLIPAYVAEYCEACQVASRSSGNEEPSSRNRGQRRSSDDGEYSALHFSVGQLPKNRCMRFDATRRPGGSSTIARK